MKLDSIDVALGERSYTIHLGLQLRHATCWQSNIRYKNLFIVSNDVVGPLYLDSLVASLKGAYCVSSVVLPDGEASKSMQTLTHILDTMVAAGLGRDTTVLALGGGVIGDLAGLAAALYQRGVDLIQMPTSLLAQVDASVGGKTAVNHPLGKNLIGAFYQPKAVVIDISVLETLPEREFIAGLAEVVKYGVMWDASFFAWLKQHVALIRSRDPQTLQAMIARCCQIKAEVVAQDEKEQGLRALLNLGHTFGHALEAQTDYQTYLHGEAVAVGMRMAAELAQLMTLISQEEVTHIVSLLTAFGLPTQPLSQEPFEDYLALMRRDKKNSQGFIHFVLPVAVGQAKIIYTVETTHLQQVMT